MKSFLRVISIIKKSEIKSIYDFISIQFDNTSKLNVITKSIKNDPVISNLVSDYDITQIRQMIKFVYHCEKRENMPFADRISLFSYLLIPKKTCNLMEKLEKAYFSNAPLNVIESIANVYNGIGISAKQNILLDIVISDCNVFNANEIASLFPYSCEKLNTIKLAVKSKYPKKVINSIIQGSADDDDLKNISSFFSLNSNKPVIQALVSGNYSSSQIDALSVLINSSNPDINNNLDLFLDVSKNAEMILSLLKTFDLFSDDHEKRDNTIKKLLSFDQNKSSGVLSCIVYGLDDSTINIYASNSVDSASIVQLLLAYADGVSQKNLQKLINCKNYEERKRLRLMAECVANQTASQNKARTATTNLSISGKTRKI